MYSLEIINKTYKTTLTFLITCSLPCIFLLFYGIELLNYNSVILGYIVLILGLSGILLALNSLFVLISCSDKEYDWSNHIEITDNELLIIKSKPYIVNKLDLKLLKQMEIKKTDNEVAVTFVTDEREIKCTFTQESYDTLIFFKKKYLIGW